MFKKIFLLFRIGRKLAKSGAINSISEIYNPPILIKIFFFILGFSLTNKEQKKIKVRVKNYMIFTQKVFQKLEILWLEMTGLTNTWLKV